MKKIIGYTRNTSNELISKRYSNLLSTKIRNFSIKKKYTLEKNLDIQVEQTGDIGLIDTRLKYSLSNGKPMSPWHNIPLYAPLVNNKQEQNVYFHFINEIPKGARAKMEISTKEAFNPIKQDVKKGKPRYYHYDSLVNYGCFPQTWEDPSHIDIDTKHGGDNDPLDVIDIGWRTAAIGEIYVVKVLGVLGMIDDGETDWKVITIAQQDPLAALVNDLKDLEKYEKTRGMVEKVRDWFEMYKLPEGKPKSVFAFDGQAMPKDYTLKVISKTHQHWKKLVQQKTSTLKMWIPNHHT